MEIADAAGRTGKWKSYGFQAQKQPPPEQTGKVVAELGADRTRKQLGRTAKEQAGNFDPGMEAAERRQPLRASEKPLRADRFRAELARGEPGSIEPRAGKSGFWVIRGTSVWWQKPERVSRAGVLWISATGIRKGSQH